MVWTTKSKVLLLEEKTCFFNFNAGDKPLLRLGCVNKHLVLSVSAHGLKICLGPYSRKLEVISIYNVTGSCMYKVNNIFVQKLLKSKLCWCITITFFFVCLQRLSSTERNQSNKHHWANNKEVCNENITHQGGNATTFGLEPCTVYSWPILLLSINHYF